MEQLKQERDEYLAYAQRSRADFLNYKQEETRRIEAIKDYQKEEWALELLEIMDLFEKARQAVSEKEAESAILKGFAQIERQLKDFLAKQGVEEIEIEAGAPFNPEIAEAMDTVAGEEGEEGTVAEVLQKGYLFKDKVLRPVRVKVAS